MESAAVVLHPTAAAAAAAAAVRCIRAVFTCEAKNTVAIPSWIIKGVFGDSNMRWRVCSAGRRRLQKCRGLERGAGRDDRAPLRLGGDRRDFAATNPSDDIRYLRCTRVHALAEERGDSADCVMCLLSSRRSSGSRLLRCPCSLLFRLHTDSFALQVP